MANFGNHLAYPTDTMQARQAGVPTDAQLTSRPGLLGRVFRALSRAIDEAPFDLAWPPSPRAYHRRPLR